MKKGVIIGIVVTILGVLAAIVGIASYMNQQQSIGIIGGADGPTVILVAGSLWGALLVPAIVLALILVAVVVTVIVKKKREN